MENRNNNFNMYNAMASFTKYSRTYILSSIPKIHNDIKIHFADEMYNLTRNMMEATYKKGSLRMKYIQEMQVNISMLDFLILQLKDIKCLKLKTLNNTSNLLFEIKNKVYGWKFNEENKKE